MYNINPRLWGANSWAFLHYITFAYPDNPSHTEQNGMRTFFNSISDVLPCEKCRINYKKHLNDFPLNEKALSSRNDLILWLIDIHNEVNKEYNGPVLTYDSVYQQYMNKNKFKLTRFHIICIGLVIILCLIIYVKYWMYHN